MLPDFASPMGNTDVVVTLPDLSFPLAQCTGLEIGEHFGVVARPSVLDACFESEDILDELHDLVETSLMGSSDVFMSKNLLALVVIMFFLTPLIIPMFHLLVHYLVSSPRLS